MTCATGKVCFPSERSAKACARSKKKHEPLRVYLCPECHQWHLSKRHRRIDRALRGDRRGRAKATGDAPELDVETH